MLILPDSILEARRRLLRAFDEGKITEEQLNRKALELDPDDFVALLGLGRILQEAGDLTGAETCFRRAIEANPCASHPFQALAGLLDEQPDRAPLALGLAELAFLKCSRENDDDPLLNGAFEDGVETHDDQLPSEVHDALLSLPHQARARLVAKSIRENRASEPASVTEALRTLRLVDDLLDGDALEAPLIDAIIAEGPAIAPLLVGVMRAWAQNSDEDDNEVDMENAIALLGETGTPAQMPALLEFADLENETASGVSAWALGRIVNRFPVEAAAFVESILPSLGIAERLAVADLIVKHPAFDPTATLFGHLSEDLESMSKRDRGRFLSLYLVCLAANPELGGVARSRAILQRQGALIPSEIRREVAETLELFDSAEDLPPRQVAGPAPSVYEICAGEAVWANSEDEDEDSDDDLPPEPIRRPPTPGRNDPCWCDSGKKYKKCHMDSDEREARQSRERSHSHSDGEVDFMKLRRSLIDFLRQVVPERRIASVLEEFFGDAPGLTDRDNEMTSTEWMVHDWVIPGLGRTLPEQFLHQRAARLSERQREIVTAWGQSYVGLYEIQSVKPGVGVEVKDLTSEDTVFVHDMNTSRTAAKWDVILVRLVPGERGMEFCAFCLAVPRMHLPAVREWLEADRETQGLSWPAYFKANWPRIRRYVLELGETWLDELQLRNSDDEEFLLSKSVYRVSDAPRVIEAIQASPGWNDDSPEDGSKVRFVWLKDDRTILGSVELRNGELIWESNSRERHARGKALIEALGGESLRHLRDEFSTQNNLKRRATQQPLGTETPSGGIPEHVRNEILAKFNEEHHIKWLDTQIPALDGKTPRQAAKTPKGRAQLEELLKSIEQSEEQKRRRGEPFITMERMRADLGLAEPGAP